MNNFENVYFSHTMLNFAPERKYCQKPIQNESYQLTSLPAICMFTNLILHAMLRSLTASSNLSSSSLT